MKNRLAHETIENYGNMDFFMEPRISRITRIFLPSANVNFRKFDVNFHEFPLSAAKNNL